MSFDCQIWLYGNNNDNNKNNNNNDNKNNNNNNNDNNSNNNDNDNNNEIYRVEFVQNLSYNDIYIQLIEAEYICVRKLTMIGSDNGLSPGRRLPIILTNAVLLPIGGLRTNLSAIVR